MKTEKNRRKKASGAADKYRFTIVIPTFNRPDYLQRLVGYYNRPGSDRHFKIIVADSSYPKNKFKNAEIINSCSALDILYLDDFPVTIHPNIKISEALGYAETAYSVVCPDDDFVMIDAVNQGIDFFEENHEFTCVHGRYIRFYLIDNKTEKARFQWHFVYPPRPIIDDDPKKRAIIHLSDPINMLHAVYRTEFLRMIHRENKQYIGDSFFGEEFLSALPFFYGKMQVLDDIFAIKDAQSTPKTTAKEDKQHFYFPSDYKREGTYEKRYSAFIDILSKHLAECVKEDFSRSKQFLDAIFLEHIEKNYNTSTARFSFVFHRLRSALDKIKLSSRLDRFIRWTYKRVFLLGETKLLEDIPSSEYYHGLRDLKTYLTEEGRGFSQE